MSRTNTVAVIQEIKKRLGKALEQLQMSDVKIAEIVGVQSQSVLKWRSQKYNMLPSVENLHALAVALGEKFDAGYILTGRERNDESNAMTEEDRRRLQRFEDACNRICNSVDRIESRLDRIEQRINKIERDVKSCPFAQAPPILKTNGTTAGPK